MDVSFQLSITMLYMLIAPEHLMLLHISFQENLDQILCFMWHQRKAEKLYPRET
jgi:hypothetical protein